MTKQDQIRMLLIKSGIPYKDIKVFGSQIIIVAWSFDAAKKWASLLANFAKVRKPVESIEHNKVNRNTVLKPTRHTVWLVGAAI